MSNRIGIVAVGIIGKEVAEVIQKSISISNSIYPTSINLILAIIANLPSLPIIVSSPVSNTIVNGTC